MCKKSEVFNICGGAASACGGGARACGGSASARGSIGMDTEYRNTVFLGGRQNLSTKKLHYIYIIYYIYIM